MRALRSNGLTLPNTEATFVRGKWKQRSLKPSKPIHFGIHWIALAEYSQMSTICQGFKHFLLALLHYSIMAKLATDSIRVNAFMLGVV